jgi:hypothetical protein
MTTAVKIRAPEIGALLRAEPPTLRTWMESQDAGRITSCLISIFVGAGLYGAAMGCWRAPLQGLFVAIKFPLIILFTTLNNALLNAMLAPLLGLNISLRQTLMAVLMSFTVASAILGSFSPIAAFVIWNAPPLASNAQSAGWTYSFIMIMHVFVIALAGITANVKLLQLLRLLSRSEPVARRVLFAWLAGNLFLGSQLSWILRPFIGSPALEVEFLRKTAFQGNFYEAVYHSFLHLFTVP